MNLLPTYLKLFQIKDISAEGEKFERNRILSGQDSIVKNIELKPALAGKGYKNEYWVLDVLHYGSMLCNHGIYFCLRKRKKCHTHLRL